MSALEPVPGILEVLVDRVRERLGADAARPSPQGDGAYWIHCPFHRGCEGALWLASGQPRYKCDQGSDEEWDTKKFSEWALSSGTRDPGADDGDDDEAQPGSKDDAAQNLSSERVAGPPRVWPKLEVPKREFVHRTFPLDVLPLPVRAWVEATARRQECDPAHPAVAALSALAACVQRKAWLETGDGHKTALTLWTAVFRESGGGKSTIANLAHEDIAEWERERAEAMAAQIAAESTERKAMEAEQKRAMRTIENEKEADKVRSARADAERLAAQLASFKVAVAPQITCNNPTAARLVAIMAKQGGRLSLVAGEVNLSTLFSLGGGRGAAPTDSGILDAWDGLDVGEERQEREGGLGGDRKVLRAHLSMHIASQPSRWAAVLKQHPDLLNNGFLARCLCAVPADLSEAATYELHPMPAESRERYRTLARRLLDLPCPEAGEIESITLSPDAVERWKDFRRGELRARISKSGDMHAGPLRSYGERAHAQALHLAGVIHLAEHAPGHFRLQVSGETMGRAVRAMTEYFLPTAVDVLELLGARPSDRQVDGLLRTLRGWSASGKPSCSERELYRAAHIEKRELVEPLKELIDCGALVPEPPRPKEAHRPRAPLFWIHPDLGGEA